MRYSDKEIATIRAMRPNHTVAEIAARLGRTYEGVKSKVAELGLHRPPRRWTPKEDAMIVRHYESERLHKLAARLNRTVAAIRTRRTVLRRTSGQPSAQLRWTPAEDAFLLANYDSAGRQFVAQHLGRSVAAITHRRHILRLRTGEPWLTHNYRRQTSATHPTSR